MYIESHFILSAEEVKAAILAYIKPDVSKRGLSIGDAEVIVDVDEAGDLTARVQVQVRGPFDG